MIQNGWYCCPVCGQKLFRVETEAVCVGVLIKCKRCKREIRASFKTGARYTETAVIDKPRVLSAAEIEENDCRSCLMVLGSEVGTARCPFETCAV